MYYYFKFLQNAFVGQRKMNINITDKNQSKHAPKKSKRADDLISDIRDNCTDCSLCRKECEFLDRYVSPKMITNGKDSTNPELLRMAYECSLCGLCGAVCPAGLQPGELFSALREASVLSGDAPLKSFRQILAFEKRGTSRRYSWYSLPENCDTVFFPGCELPGTRPTKTLDLYNHLKTLIPDIGIVLDCCCKPSRDLGRLAYFHDMLREMKSYLLSHGVKRLITACPNCHSVFSTHGKPLEVISVYEVIARHGLPGNPAPHKRFTIHDSCVTRHDTSIQNAVRDIIETKGLSIMEMPHSREKAICCGKGAAVSYIDPKLANAWRNQRLKETAGHPIITYCAGCAGAFKDKTSVFHLIDILFEPQSAASGKPRVSRSPMTYLNRLWLKHVLRKHENPAFFRERNC